MIWGSNVWPFVFDLKIIVVIGRFPWTPWSLVVYSQQVLELDCPFFLKQRLWIRILAQLFATASVRGPMDGGQSIKWSVNLERACSCIALWHHCRSWINSCDHSYSGGSRGAASSQRKGEAWDLRHTQSLVHHWIKQHVRRRHLVHQLWWNASSGALQAAGRAN